jgi:NADH-quinone oxidoreductase subunit C
MAEPTPPPGENAADGPNPVASELSRKIEAQLQDAVQRLPSLPGELSYEVKPEALLTAGRTLRDAPDLKFEMLMDLAGVDYLHYGRDEWQTESATRSGFSRGRVARATAPDPAMAGRFAVAYHLLSITHNTRLRLRVKCPDTQEPTIDSVTDIWASAN